MPPSTCSAALFCWTLSEDPALRHFASTYTSSRDARAGGCVTMRAAVGFRGGGHVVVRIGIAVCGCHEWSGRMRLKAPGWCGVNAGDQGEAAAGIPLYIKRHDPVLSTIRTQVKPKRTGHNTHQLNHDASNPPPRRCLPKGPPLETQHQTPPLSPRCLQVRQTMPLWILLCLFRTGGVFL